MRQPVHFSEAASPTHPNPGYVQGAEGEASPSLPGVCLTVPQPPACWAPTPPQTLGKGENICLAQCSRSPRPALSLRIVPAPSARKGHLAYPGEVF